MEFDYFYGQQAEQFSFYRIPKVLFTSEYFRDVSLEAKLLYGIMLDRMSLSQKNGWYDEENRVYIIFTVENVMEYMGCANKKACQLLSELENKVGLIKRKRQGLGKPSWIYVKNFITVQENIPEEHFLKCENDTSGSVGRTSLEVSKAHTNNTEYNNTEFNDTDPILSSGKTKEYSYEGRNGREEVEKRSDYHLYFFEKLEIERLEKENPCDADLILEILELITDAVCSNRKMIRIAGDDKPAEIVKGQLMKLKADHIRYVLEGLEENSTRIRNMKQYLLAALYNAPFTMEHHYRALARHDMANGLI